MDSDGSVSAPPDLASAPEPSTPPCHIIPTRRALSRRLALSSRRRLALLRSPSPPRSTRGFREGPEEFPLFGQARSASPRNLNDDSLCQLAASVTAAAKLKRREITAGERRGSDPPPLELGAGRAGPRKRALSAEMVQTLDRLADILLTECRTSSSPPEGKETAQRVFGSAPVLVPAASNLPPSLCVASPRSGLLRSPVLALPPPPAEGHSSPPALQRQSPTREQREENEEDEEDTEKVKEKPKELPVLAQSVTSAPAKRRKRKWRRTYDPAAAAAKRRRLRRHQQLLSQERAAIASRSPDSSLADTRESDDEGESTAAASHSSASSPSSSHKWPTMPHLEAAAGTARRKRRRRPCPKRSPKDSEEEVIQLELPALPPPEADPLKSGEQDATEALKDASPPGLSPSTMPEPVVKRRRGRPPKRPPPPLTPMGPSLSDSASSAPRASSVLDPKSPRVPAQSASPEKSDVANSGASSGECNADTLDSTIASVIADVGGTGDEGDSGAGGDVPSSPKRARKRSKLVGPRARARRKSKKVQSRHILSPGSLHSNVSASSLGSPQRGQVSNPETAAASTTVSSVAATTTISVVTAGTPTGAATTPTSTAAISPRPVLSAKELFTSELSSLESPHAWRKLGEALVKGLRRFHTVRCEASFGAVLLELPDPARYPEYYYAVSEPLSLGTVEKMLRPALKNSFTSLWEFDYAVLRTLANARWYAGAGTPLGLLTEDMEKEYRRLKVDLSPTIWSEDDLQRWINSSLSTIDLDPRSSPYRGATREAELLRCICGNPLDDIDFGCVQCDQCYAWQHVYCVLQQQQQHQRQHLQQQQQNQQFRQQQLQKELKEEQDDEEVVEKKGTDPEGYAGEQTNVKEEDEGETNEEKGKEEFAKSEPVPHPSTPESYVCEVCRPRALRRELSCMMLKRDAHVGCQYFYTLVWAGRMYRLGEFVFVPKEEDYNYFDVVCIDRLWINEQGEKRLYGHFYLRPYETRHESTRRFYPNELLRWSCCQEYPLSVVLGKCVVLDPRVYFRGWRHRRFGEADHFVCEYRVNQARTTFSKIRDEWALVAGNLALSDGANVPSSSASGPPSGGSQSASVLGHGAMSGSPAGATSVWSARRIPHFFMERRQSSPESVGGSGASGSSSGIVAAKREFTAEAIQSHDFWNATTGRLRGPNAAASAQAPERGRKGPRARPGPPGKGRRRSGVKLGRRPKAQTRPHSPGAKATKLEPEMVPEPSVPEAPAVKRGRGRPRKNPLLPKELSKTTATSVARRQPTGRPRGRPRKHPPAPTVVKAPVVGRGGKRSRKRPPLEEAKTTCPADSTAERQLRERARAFLRSPASSAEASRAVEVLTEAPTQLLTVTWAENGPSQRGAEDNDSVGSSGDVLCENFVARLDEEEDSEGAPTEDDAKEGDLAIARYYAHVQAVAKGEPAFVEVAEDTCSDGDDEEEEDEEEEKEEEGVEGGAGQGQLRWEMPMVLRKSFSGRAGGKPELPAVVSSLLAPQPSSEVFECDSSSSPPHQLVATSSATATGHGGNESPQPGFIAVPRVTADSTTTEQKPLVRALVEYSSSSEDEDDESPAKDYKPAAEVKPSPPEVFEAVSAVDVQLATVADHELPSTKDSDSAFPDQDKLAMTRDYEASLTKDCESPSSHEKDSLLACERNTFDCEQASVVNESEAVIKSESDPARQNKSLIINENELDASSQSVLNNDETALVSAEVTESVTSKANMTLIVNEIESETSNMKEPVSDNDTESVLTKTDTSSTNEIDSLSTKQINEVESLSTKENESGSPHQIECAVPKNDSAPTYDIESLSTMETSPIECVTTKANELVSPKPIECVTTKANESVSPKPIECALTKNDTAPTNEIASLSTKETREIESAAMKTSVPVNEDESVPLTGNKSPVCELTGESVE